MKYAMLVLASALSLAACAVDAPDATEDQQSQSVVDPSGGAETQTIRRCSTRTVGICSGASFGTRCRVSPQLWCLPSNELPDGEILCLCQSQSTI